MNMVNFQQIVNHYIDKFETTNNSVHQEYYKWQIAKQFKPMIDTALSASDDEFSAKLYAVKKLSRNVIDSYTQPFHGLCKFAEREPATVRQMLLDLLKEDDISKQEKVNAFLKNSAALRQKYYPDSFLYNDDMHSVTGYMFLYDPDHNFLYKASHARKFADCIEFYDDWGYGANTRLDVYFRMCDEVLEAINANQPLLATAASRFDIDPLGMHPDTNKHILLFDMIYCCSTYSLFHGIHFVVPKNDERKLMQERKEKAVRLSAELSKAKERLLPVEEGKQLLDEIIKPGVIVHHRVFGDGPIVAITDTMMTVDFSKAGIKTLGTLTSIGKGLITLDDAMAMEKIAPYSDCLLNKKQLQDAVAFAEKQLAPYVDYLD